MTCARVALVGIAVVLFHCGPASIAPQKPERLPGLPPGAAFHFAFDVDGAPLVFSMSGGRTIWRWEEKDKGWRALIEASAVPGDLFSLRQDTTGAVMMAGTRWYRISGGTPVPLGGETTCQNAYWLGTRPDGSSVCGDGTNLWSLAKGASDWQPIAGDLRRIANWNGVMLADGTLLNFPDTDHGQGIVAMAPDGTVTEVLACETPLLRNCLAPSGAPQLASDGRVHFLVGGGNTYEDHDIVALTPGTWATEKLVNFSSKAPDQTQFTARVNSFALGAQDEWFVLRKEEYEDSYPQWLIGAGVRDSKGQLISKDLGGSGDLYRRGTWLYYFRYSSPAGVSRFKL